MHYAAANLSSDVIEFLISKRIDINNSTYYKNLYVLGDAKGRTPLMIACKLGRIKNVGAIIEEQ